MNVRSTMLTITLILSCASLAFSYSSGPLNGKTGAPGEGVCTDCHNSFPLNSGDGDLLIMIWDDTTGIAFGYQPGKTYWLTVAIYDTGQSRWGFEVTSILDNGNEGGSLSAYEPFTTQLSEGAGTARDYLKQTLIGTFPGYTSSAGWIAEWTAPAAGSGTVAFYAAGNAANNNGNNAGDYIYTEDLDLPEGAPGFVGIRTILPTTPLLLEAYPNPFNPDVTLNLATLPGNQPIVLDLLDISGRLLNHLTVISQNGGVIQLPMNLEALPSGKYFVRAVSEHGSALTTIVKVK